MIVLKLIDYIFQDTPIIRLYGLTSYIKTYCLYILRCTYKMVYRISLCNPPITFA